MTVEVGEERVRRGGTCTHARDVQSCEREGETSHCGQGFLLTPPPPSLLRSDLALRNCLLTSDLTVRIGDYGLAHSNYKVGRACECVYACGSVCVTC